MQRGHTGLEAAARRLLVPARACKVLGHVVQLPACTTAHLERNHGGRAHLEPLRLAARGAAHLRRTCVHGRVCLKCLLLLTRCSGALHGPSSWRPQAGAPSAPQGQGRVARAGKPKRQCKRQQGSRPAHARPAPTWARAVEQSTSLVSQPAAAVGMSWSTGRMG